MMSNTAFVYRETRVDLAIESDVFQSGSDLLGYRIPREAECMPISSCMACRQPVVGRAGDR